VALRPPLPYCPIENAAGTLFPNDLKLKDFEVDSKLRVSKRGQSWKRWNSYACIKVKMKIFLHIISYEIWRIVRSKNKIIRGIRMPGLNQQERSRKTGNAGRKQEVQEGKDMFKKHMQEKI
jgi:hypothetical protein